MWKLSICWEPNVYQMKDTFIRNRKVYHDEHWISNSLASNQPEKEVTLWTLLWALLLEALKKIFATFFSWLPLLYSEMLSQMISCQYQVFLYTFIWVWYFNSQKWVKFRPWKKAILFKNSSCSQMPWPKELYCISF